MKIVPLEEWPTLLDASEMSAKKKIKVLFI